MMSEELYASGLGKQPFYTMRGNTAMYAMTYESLPRYAVAT